MSMKFWRSRGAGLKRQALGLGDVSIVLPDGGSFGEAVERISHKGTKPIHSSDSAASFGDPWGNQGTLSQLQI